MSEKESGTLSLESAKCTGCGTCNEICPIGVYDFDETACKTIPARVADCFACGACVKQCPEHALEFKS